MARALGLDPGTVRVGVAVSDSTGSLAFPRPPLVAGDGLIEAVAALVAEEAAGTVVVGRPVSLAGLTTESTRAADELCRVLGRRLAGIEVVAHDERLSTHSAARAMRGAGVSARRQRSRIDSASAVVMLQSWLDAQPR